MQNKSRPIPGAWVCAGTPGELPGCQVASVPLWASFSVREFRNDNAVTVSLGQNNMGTLTGNCQESRQGKGEILVKCVSSEILAVSH